MEMRKTYCTLTHRLELEQKQNHQHTHSPIPNHQALCDN